MHRRPLGRGRQLEHEYALVADLLQTDCRRLPVNRALEGYEVVVGATAVVVHVRGDDVSGKRFDGLDHVATEVRMAEVETDPDLVRLQVFLDEMHERTGPRQLVRDHFDRDLGHRQA